MSLTDLSERLAAQIGLLLPAHCSILVGLSGGVDSVVLLHLLNNLASRFSWQLSALHVHHGISPNADAWADFCTGLCAQYAIPLHIEHVDIAPLREHGIEAAARKLRHAAFARQKSDFVALAHHADDQAETLLLQLLRGAGVRGASAMPTLSRVEGSARTESENVCAGSIVRPLLHCTRREILDYAAAHNLRWIEDESNADDSYPRNFLRHRLLPLLEAKFPAYRVTLARSARHFAEAAELMNVLAGQDAQNYFDGATLAVTRLRELDVTRAKNLLRWFLHQHGAPMPDHTRLEEMLRQFCLMRADAQVCVAWQDWEVRCYRGRVYACRALPEVNAGWRVAWHGEAELAVPQLRGTLHFVRGVGEGISLKKLTAAPVTLRLRQGSETLRPHQNAVTHTLKNLLQEHHVPPWLRDRLPLLYCGEVLVCVPDVAVAAAYHANANEAGMLVNLLR
ncbi:MAG TPA: tRNA lysidine(34) synthetase TilS [Gallionella sp.]|nr:tRNA lysidine(34) synthetase TilS [Gallionella sp.]